MTLTTDIFALPNTPSGSSLRDSSTSVNSTGVILASATRKAQSRSLGIIAHIYEQQLNVTPTRVWYLIPLIGTAATTLDKTLELRNGFELAKLSEQSRKKFLNYVEGVNWQYQSEATISEAIHMMLRLGAPLVARHLSEIGRGLYPSSAGLERAASVLAAPKVQVLDRRSESSLDDSMRWIQDYAHEHRGQWVALKAGQLIAMAASRTKLMEKLDATTVDTSIMVTRIP